MTNPRSMEWLTTSGFLEELRDFENQHTWDSFVQRFMPAIIAFARRIGVAEEDREDAAQDIFLAFANSYRKGQYDRSKGSLRTWLFTIAYRRSIDLLRQRRSQGREVQVGDDAGGTLGSIPAPEDCRETWDREWDAFVLSECLRRVRDEVRAKTWQAFEKVVLDEEDPEKVADELSMSRNAVYIAKYRVMQRLEKLKEEFEESP